MKSCIVTEKVGGLYTFAVHLAKLLDIPFYLGKIPDDCDSVILLYYPSDFWKYIDKDLHVILPLSTLTEMAFIEQSVPIYDLMSAAKKNKLKLYVPDKMLCSAASFLNYCPRPFVSDLISPIEWNPTDAYGLFYSSVVSRKNIPAQIAACYNKQVTTNIAVYDKFKPVFQLLGIYCIVSDTGKNGISEDFSQVISRVEVSLQVTFAEAFNYHVAECIVREIPCITGPNLTWFNTFTRELFVTKDFEAGTIYEKLRELDRFPEEHIRNQLKWTHEAIKPRFDAMNEEIRYIFKDIV